MIWIAILALAARPDGGPVAEGPVGPRPAIVGASAPDARPAARSIAPPRRAHRSPFSSPWTVSGIDEFDAEEVDETWLIQLQLDAHGAAFPGWSAWGTPRSVPARESSNIPGRSPGPVFPLRC